MFSMRRWLLDENSKESMNAGCLILQGNGNFDALTKAYIQSIISTVVTCVMSPDMHASKEDKLWLVLDEYPQLGKLESFEKLLEVGRSKGVRSIIANQNIYQSYETLGENVTKSMLSMISTKIICAVYDDTATWASDLIGEQEVEEKSTSRSSDNNSSAEQLTHSLNTKKRAVVTEDELAKEVSPIGLGPQGAAGIRAIVLNGGKHVVRALWPGYLHMTSNVPPVVSAPWTQEGWPDAAVYMRKQIEALELKKEGGDDEDD